LTAAPYPQIEPVATRLASLLALVTIQVLGRPTGKVHRPSPSMARPEGKTPGALQRRRGNAPVVVALGVTVVLLVLIASVQNLTLEEEHSVTPPPVAAPSLARTTAAASAASTPRSVNLPQGSGLAPAGGANSEWVNVTAGIPNGPPPRSNASVVYDPLGPYLLLFGGQIGPTPLNDTWTFANGVWTQLHPRISPVARFGAGITYDAFDRYVVLFGGATGSGPGGVIQVNATWKFVGGNWHHLGTVTPPRGRSFPSFAYDPTLDANVLFGGLLPTNQSAETWELAATNWTPITSGGPGEPLPRVAGSIAFDNTSGQLIMFGGWDPETASPLLLNDTWSFLGNAADPNASTWVEESTPSGPSPRYDAAAAFNPTVNAIVLFGGQGTNEVLSDTWLWAGTAWVQYAGTGPSPNPRLGDVLSECPTPGGSEASPVFANILLGGSLSPGVLAADVWFFGALPLAVLPPVVTPTATDVGHPAMLSVFAFGGASLTYTYTWEQLPPGCASRNLASYTCTPSGSSNAPYLVFVSVRNASGATVTSPTAAWSVNALPTVILFTALPSPVPAGSQLSISVLFSGGTSPLTFQYSGLPAGCSSIDAAQFNCTPQTPGNYSLKVQITDADGHNDTGFTALVVGDPVAVGSSLWQYVIEGIGFAVAVIILLEVLRRKVGRRAGSSQFDGANGNSSNEGNGVKPWDETKAPATGDQTSGDSGAAK
jgi:hypothetical protein